MENPLNIKSWWNLLISEKSSDYLSRSLIYENALKYLPYSYKLWFNYLNEAREFALNSSNIYIEKDVKEIYLLINNLHERALVNLRKFPRIWCDYIEFLIYQNKLSRVIMVFNNSLQNLSIPQHELVWKIYLPWSLSLNIMEIGVNSFERYLKLNSSIRNEYIEYLIEIKQYDDALKQIVYILNEESFKFDKSENDYWDLIVEIIMNQDLKTNIKELNLILRSGIGRYSNKAKIVIAIANLYIKEMNFHEARKVFEEGISKSQNTKDFTLIFNSYLHFEEQHAKYLISKDNEIKDHNIKDGDDSVLLKQNPYTRINSLLARRPFLLSDIELKKNPNNTKEWIKRANFTNNPIIIEEVYQEAINKITENMQAPELLFIEYCKFLELNNNIKKINEVFYEASLFLYSDKIWIEWAQVHIRSKNYSSALKISKKGSKIIKNSLKLWSLYIDLESFLGNSDKVIKAYQKVIDLKIANIPIILNYTNYLIENSNYSLAFKIYEEAVKLFTWPQVYYIWVIYLDVFIKKYPTKSEYIRDLFESVIQSCPKEKVKSIFYMYSQYEEENGFIFNVLNILNRAIQGCNKDDKVELYSVHISKAAKYYGIEKIREVFTKSLCDLDGDNAISVGIKYINIEKNLNEIDRARSIFIYLSQFAISTISQSEEFWKEWDSFEISYGNEKTYKDMLRVKRGIINYIT